MKRFVLFAMVLWTCFGCCWVLGNSVSAQAGGMHRDSWLGSPLQRVTFNANGGSCEATTWDYTMGSKYGYLPNATRSGYIFDGWWTAANGGSKVTASSSVTGYPTRTLYAHWISETLWVTFNANGGSCSTGSKSYTIGNTYGTLPTATKTGFMFTGWWTSVSGGTQITGSTKVTTNSATVLYAHWTGNPQTVNFDANGGNCSASSQTYTIGNTYGTLPSATWLGYMFAGWWTAASGGTQVSASSTVTTDSVRTLYAHWTSTKQVVMFDANGGNCEKSTLTYIMGNLYGTLPTATRPGYTFLGWWTALSEGSQITTNSIVTTNASRTLYALWTQPLQILNASGPDEHNAIVVSFLGKSNNTYALQYAESLAVSPIWDNLKIVSAEQDGVLELSISLPDGWKGGFYRVADGAQEAPLQYLVVDMSEGPNALKWPITQLKEPPEGGWSDEYKTTKLVLRSIPAGTFTMGSPTNELGHYLDEVQHEVTISKSFYTGVFEVTQKQWELATGMRPSHFCEESSWATRPVEKVSYQAIRGKSVGKNWPTDNAVDTESFLGVLRAKTGLVFDLPTEAQWQYACRAGTVSALNNGKELTGTSTCSNVAEVARYKHNGGGGAEAWSDVTKGTAKVGSYKPNAWGLYDMHGNVGEWCLDWYGEYDTNVAQDPVGPTIGTDRLVPGLGWMFEAQFCRSACRTSVQPDMELEYVGLRLVCSMPAQ